MATSENTYVPIYGDCIGCDGYILIQSEAPYCPSCAREHRLFREMAAIAVSCWRECRGPGASKLIEAVSDLWAFRAMLEYQR